MISWFLILAAFLAACSNAPSEVTVTSQVTVTSEPPPTPTETRVPPTATATPIPTYSIEQLTAMSSADKLAMAPQVGTAPADVVASFLPKGADVADVTWGQKSLTYWERVVSYHGKVGGQEVTLYYDLESGQWAKKYDSFESLSQIPASQIPDVMVLGDRLIHVNPPYEDGWVVKPPIWTEDGKQIFRDEKGFPRVVFDTANKIWLDLPDYPVFDQAENILTPEKLPAVPIEKVLSGEFAEIVLRMYHEGKIRQISPDAKPYPFQWGNKMYETYGSGMPMSIYMPADERFFYEENPPFTFTLFQSEFLGEKVALVATVWLNSDGTVSVMPQTRLFSSNIPQYSDDSVEELKSFAPFSFAFNTQQDCLKIKSSSQKYCDYHMSVQEEWLKLVQDWVKKGIMPAGLSRIPLQMLNGTSTYFTN